ncbi:hypothetical protein SCALIN_C27_0044 [Candidatus Scalindua japonica]|uniref:Uncharacterized protein n=1 Tax=Candidatus Scalindua japonica TaxID=1284222 RepID=A0A286U0H9_9BACT|nr:hypothetical protein [Candidatus Scalindua japonica]GAX61650.1 hypothetical protein SCALIN_C27_0044 [Candidatus Scalindua japonica]
MEKDEAVKELQKESLQGLSDKDLLFLIESYVTKRNDYDKIASLINGDEDVIAKMIDSDRVFNKVMSCTERILAISPYFLFSLLIRRAFKEKREDTKFIEKTIDALNKTEPIIPWNENRLMCLLEDNYVSNYIANMLAQFIESSKLFSMGDDEKKSHQYIVDMIADSLNSDNLEKFYIYCHIGNYTLFLTGMIPEYIKYRYEYKRRPLDEHYYVGFGKTYYGLASEHTNARRIRLTGTLSQLSEGFEAVSQVLSFMNKEYLCSTKPGLA